MLSVNTNDVTERMYSKPVYFTCLDTTVPAWMCLVVPRCVWTCLGMPGCVWMCLSMSGFVCAYLDVPGCDWPYLDVFAVWLDVPGCVWVSGLGSIKVDQVLKYTKYPKYIPSTSTGQVLIF